MLAACDSLASATARAAGRGAQAPAALVALREFLEEATVRQLSDAIGLTHSATVRLVDRLVADGYVVRRGAGRDRRAVAIGLTAAGEAVADRVRQARRLAVEELLESLSTRERQVLAGCVDRMLAGLARRRLDTRARGEAVHGWLCRLCDFRACGRPEGLCPVAGTRVTTTPPVAP
jgi:DNA-binding MarR family transcriptional regulator